MRRRPKRKKAARRPIAAPDHPVPLIILGLGARGDGLAVYGGAPIYVAGALPGEHVQAQIVRPVGDGWAADLVAVEEPAAARIEPPCPHFGTCGGCAVQHFAPANYRAWKRARIVEALSKRGFEDPPVMETVATPPGSRRRATFVATLKGGKASIGFHRRRSDALIDIETCNVLAPPLVGLMNDLRRSMPDLLSQGGRYGWQALLCDTGIDLTLVADRDPTLEERQALAGFAEKLDLARLSWRNGEDLEPIAWRRPATVRFGTVDVAPPPGAFLQASKEGETAIIGAMRDTFDSMQSVADLFSGCGSLCYPVAAAAKVHAVDADKAMIDALTAAAHAAQCSQITAECRDLYARPLEATELAAYDTVIFDPPRAGARAQAERLAASKVPLVIGVSCDPATFARDARTLVDGGYRLERVTPVDQFLWSASVELVAVFRRAEVRTTSRPRRR